MRRKDREITDINAVFAIIERCKTIHLAMVDDGKPYAVTMNFGYRREGDALILYLHSACEGRKTDILRKNPTVFFQMDCNGEPIAGTAGNPCSYGWRYESVTGSGTAVFLEDDDEKTDALNRLLGHVAETAETFSFPPAALAKTCVFRIRSVDMIGKQCK